jgi:Zn-dependent protease
MTLEHVDILFQLIAFLFAISVHESAHAWMALRRGDPTAYMLGRVTLNPIKHIDPIGTVLLPLIAAVTHIPLLGWAKPTPVNPRNFRNPVLDDILTSVAGPVSNFLIAIGAVFLLAIISFTSATGHAIVRDLTQGIYWDDSSSPLVPIGLLCYEFMIINVVLGMFNLLPVPPLDGSHVLRHFLPESVRVIYDRVGMFGLLALIYFGGRFLALWIHPALNFFDFIVSRF